MDWIGRAAIIALTMLTLAAARAEAPAPPHPAVAQHPAVAPHAAVAPEHVCLNPKERQAAIQSGKVINLAAAMRTARKRTSGTLVRASLCQGKEGLVYVLTVLGRDGKVARLTVDAVKGTLVGQR
jgi:outer membrane biosynthesis protein TonB